MATSNSSSEADKSGEDSSTAKDDLQQKNTSLPSPTRQKIIIVIVLCLQLSSISADTLIAPFFPNIAMKKGLSNTLAGIVFSSYEIGRFVASPIAGTNLKKCPPKLMCTLGNLITTVSCAIFGTLELVENKYIFFTLCSLTRFIAGVGSAMLGVATTSIMMKATSYKTGTIVGFIEITIGSGYALGPVFGAGLYELTGYIAMFWIVGGVMVVFLPFFLQFVPKVEEEQKKPPSSFGLLAVPGFALMILCNVVTKFSGMARFVGMSDWLTVEYNQTLSFVGFMFALTAVQYIAGCFLVSWIVNKGYVYQPMIIGLCLAIIPSLLLGPSELLNFQGYKTRRLWQFIVGLVVYDFLTPTMFVPPFQAALDLAQVNGYEKGSVHMYGIVTGLVNSGIGLGASVGPIAAGAITDALDFSWAMTITGFMYLAVGVAILIYWVYMRCTNQPLAPEKDADDYEKLEEEEMEPIPADSKTQLVAKE